MHQFIKIVGVPPEALVRLHDAIKDPLMRSEPGWGHGDAPDGVIPFVEILSSKLEGKLGTYTVELRVLMSHDDFRMSDRARFRIRPTLQILERIYFSLGDDLFPPRYTTVLRLSGNEPESHIGV